MFADIFSGRHRIASDVIPNVVYGITDKLSINLNLPYLPILQEPGNTSEGLGDFFPQLEYAIYSKDTPFYQDQATILGNITLPTGSMRKNPPPGLGSPSFFLGFTFYRTMVDWLFLTGHGVQLTTRHRGIRFGNQFLYQFGLGRTFASPEGWIFSWMIEVDGQYGAKNTINHKSDPNSGGNIIYLTPSLWFSNENFLVQFGPSFPISQHWYGKQEKFNFGFNFNIAWSFYPPKKSEKK